MKIWQGKAKGIIFDLDDTLLAGKELQYGATFVALAAAHGKTFDLTSPLRKEVVGADWMDFVVPSMIKASDLLISVEQYNAAAKGILNALAPLARPFPAALRVVWKLALDYGIPLAIATSCHKDRLEASLYSCSEDFKQFFKAIVTGDDVRVGKGKPAPDLLIAAAVDLNIDPADCVYVGDSRNDQRAAANADMGFVGVLSNGILTMDDFDTDSSVAIIKTLHDFPYEKLGITRS